VNRSGNWKAARAHKGCTASQEKKALPATNISNSLGRFWVHYCCNTSAIKEVATEDEQKAHRKTNNNLKHNLSLSIRLTADLCCLEALLLIITSFSFPYRKYRPL
jgi:hypothetical protein